MADWPAYAHEGDKWILAYAAVSGVSSAQTAALFIIGQAVELYLKAAHIKLRNDEAKAIRLGHRLQGIWQECRQSDPEFMKTHDIRNSILAKDLFDPGVIKALSEEELSNFDSHRSLYHIFKELQNLKYFGLPWIPTRSTGVYVVTEHLDRYWVGFFRSLRAYLGYPGAGRADIIKIELKRDPPSIPVEAARFLGELVK
jgi:HEPN domain-containing protein